jgi:tetratricopeptide (TPR) repeat protein
MSMHRHSLASTIPTAAHAALGNGTTTLSHEQRAALHYSQGEKDRAMELYKEAARQSPGDVAVQKAYADFLYVALGRADEALPLYKRVLDLKPNDPETMQILGNLCASRQKPAEARQYFTRLLDMEPWNMAVKRSLERLPVNESQNSSFKAEILSVQKSVHEGEDERANEALDRIVRMKQETEKGRSDLLREPSYVEIQAMAANGQADRAIAALEKLLSRTPGSALAHNDLGVLYANVGNKEKALEHYRRAVELDPSAIVYKRNLADLLFIAGGDAEGALQTYVALLKDHPTDIETLSAIAQVCGSLGKREDARFFYDKILQIEPWNVTARQQRDALNSVQPAPVSYESAQALAQGGKTLEACQALEEFVRHAPGHAAAHNDLGVLYYQTGRVHEAQTEYEDAVRLDAENMTFRKNLAEYYFVVQNRSEDALKIFVDILRTHPRDAETLVNIGKICETLGRSDDARDFYRKALEVEPWNQSAREQLQRS